MQRNKKNIFLTLGEGDTGKSTVSRIFAEKSGMLDFPRTLVIEADEKTSSGKMDNRIKTMQLRNRDNFRDIEALDVGLMLIDTAGTSKMFFKESIKNAASLKNRGVLITPIMLVGARGISDSEITEWLKTLVDLPKMYVVLNPMREVPESHLEDLEKRIDAIPGPAEKIYIRMPVLETAIAKELEVVGCTLAKITHGQVTSIDSDLLTFPSVILDVGDWEIEVTKALSPIIDAIKAAKPEILEEIEETEQNADSEPAVAEADTTPSRKTAAMPKAK